MLAEAPGVEFWGQLAFFLFCMGLGSAVTVLVYRAFVYPESE